MSQEFLASSVASRLGARIVDGDLQAGDVLRLGDIEQNQQRPVPFVVKQSRSSNP